MNRQSTNKNLLEIFNFIHNLNLPTIDKYLDIQNGNVRITVGNQVLNTVTRDKITLAENLELSGQIVRDETSDSNVPETIGNFFHEMSEFIVRLNHTGINYCCESIDDELTKYRTAIKSTPFKLYEEKSSVPSSRWFFAGNTSDWRNPLFEICLTEDKKQNPEWFPSFQIDVDTTLTIEEFRKIAARYFNKKFITYTLTTASGMTILITGNLPITGPYPIFLGVGMETRSTSWHRQHILEEI